MQCRLCLELESFDVACGLRVSIWCGLGQRWINHNSQTRKNSNKGTDRTRVWGEITERREDWGLLMRWDSPSSASVHRADKGNLTRVREYHSVDWAFKLRGTTIPVGKQPLSFHHSLSYRFGLGLIHAVGWRWCTELEHVSRWLCRLADLKCFGPTILLHRLKSPWYTCQK